MSDIDDDLALDDEEYHEALLGFREARDLMKEARVARGFYPVVVPIRSDKPTGRGKGDSSSVKNVSGKTWQGWKRIERFWTIFRLSLAAAETQELLMVHRVLKSLSSVVRMIIGRVIVQRWMMARRIRRNETLEPTHMVQQS